MTICELERKKEHIGQFGQGSLALLSCKLLLKVLNIELLKILKVVAT
jgi:hypothetical protein